MDKARKAEPRANKLLYEAEVRLPFALPRCAEAGSEPRFTPLHAPPRAQLRFRREMHERKLRAVKPSVSCGPPKGFGVVSGASRTVVARLRCARNPAPPPVSPPPGAPEFEEGAAPRGALLAH